LQDEDGLASRLQYGCLALCVTKTALLELLLALRLSHTSNCMPDAGTAAAGHPHAAATVGPVARLGRHS